MMHIEEMLDMNLRSTLADVSNFVKAGTPFRPRGVDGFFYLKLHDS